MRNTQPPLRHGRFGFHGAEERNLLALRIVGTLANRIVGPDRDVGEDPAIDPWLIDVGADQVEKAAADAGLGPQDAVERSTETSSPARSTDATDQVRRASRRPLRP